MAVRESGRFFLSISKWFCVAFTTAVLLIMFTPVANMLARSLIVEEQLKKVDLAAVLSGGAYKNGALSGASNERLIYGLILYRQGWARGIIFSGAGTSSMGGKILHTATGSSDRDIIEFSEGGFMADEALKLGIPAVDMQVDALSMNTRENLVNINKYMKENRIKNCIIVTSSTHIKRAMLLAHKLGMECYPAPVKDYTGLITSAAGRLVLFRDILWEYAAIALYRLYGYI